jgi:hypothetical protein
MKTLGYFVMTARSALKALTLKSKEGAKRMANYVLDPQGYVSTPERNARSYFQVRDDWRGSGGYRLYYGDERYVSQVDGEINGKVFRTIKLAQAHCKARFGLDAIRVFD